MRLRVAPTEGKFFGDYAHWCTHRNIPWPAAFAQEKASAYVWVQSEKHLVLGLGLFESPAFVMVEYMVTNPNASLLERYRSVLLAADVVISLATAYGKMPIVHTSSRGLSRMLKRKGFALQPFATLVRDPGLQVAYVDKQSAKQAAPVAAKAPSKRLGPRKRAKKK